MELRRILQGVAAGVIFAGAGLFAAGVNPAGEPVTSGPVYVPDISQANGPLPDGVLAWDTLMQSTNVPSDQKAAHFVFRFTNIAKDVDIALKTNITSITNSTTVTNSGFWSKKITRVATVLQSTNVVTVTNFIKPLPVTILGAHGSCSCTVAELPTLPWTIPPRSNGVIGATVDLTGKFGTLFKTVTVSTDKGSKDLLLRITIEPPVIPTLTDADRARGVEMSKADRQAIFKGDCATCHIKNSEGKYGKALFDAVCAVCHEAPQRATMVPDLHNLPVTTNDAFWRTWIAHGKPATLMPAFSSAEGGPFNDMQIASLAAYLDYLIPPHDVPPPTNAPPAPARPVVQTNSPQHLLAPGAN